MTTSGKNTMSLSWSGSWEDVATGFSARFRGPTDSVAPTAGGCKN